MRHPYVWRLMCLLFVLTPWVNTSLFLHLSCSSFDIVFAFVFYSSLQVLIHFVLTLFCSDYFVWTSFPAIILVLFLIFWTAWFIPFVFQRPCWIQHSFWYFSYIFYVFNLNCLLLSNVAKSCKNIVMLRCDELKLLQKTNRNTRVDRTATKLICKSRLKL